MKHRSILALILIGAILAGCNLPTPPPTELNPTQIINTAAAKTVIALSTELAAGRNPTLTGPGASDGATPTPNSGNPGAQPTNPGQSEATNTPPPSSNATVDPDAPCNRASFVRDVTIPDGAVIPPNTTFTKTWELENTGSCTWTTGYAVVFAGNSDAMGGEAVQPLITSGEVQPGQRVQVSVRLRAPEGNGEYRGNWMLRSADGKNFGIGEKGAGIFYVQIEVAELYSFAENICSAKWSTAAGDLPCPGERGDNGGFVVQLEDPTLENGVDEEGLALFTMPQPVSGGYIVGRFPAVMVPDATDFRATIGCRQGVSNCNVRFRVTAKVDNGPEQILGEWNEAADNNINIIAADLDPYFGRATAFNLYVFVNGTPDASQAVWFYPRITK